MQEMQVFSQLFSFNFNERHLERCHVCKGIASFEKSVFSCYYSRKRTECRAQRNVKTFDYCHYFNG